MTLVTQPPDVLANYMQMWNASDEEQRLQFLESCIADDCLWADPQHHHVGKAALAENVKSFRAKYPQSSLGLASNIDHHNQRYRYYWRIDIGDTLLTKGFDVVTLNSEGLIERVDGFFGELKLQD